MNMAADQGISSLLLIAIGLVGALSLFFVLKTEIARLHLKLQMHLAETDRIVNELTARVDQLSSERDELRTPDPPLNGCNMSRRTEVLRLARRGQEPSEIANGLRLPKGEVELLLKVQSLTTGATLG